MTIKRREFVVGAGVIGVVGVTGGSVTPQPASAEHAMQMGAKQTAHASSPAQTATSAPPEKRAYTFLNPDEATWVEAAVNHMIPADELDGQRRRFGHCLFHRSAIGRRFRARR